MLSIGEFSKITGLSIKALRLYHDEQILVPKVVDQDSSYRYYDFNNIERARAIALLREMMFSLDEIKSILKNGSDDGDLVSFMETHRAQLEAKIREMRKVTQSIDKLVEAEKRAGELAVKASATVEEKSLPTVQVAGIRITGKYSVSGEIFSKLGKSLAMSISGKPMMLIYDGEYKEEGADFECCFPVRKPKSVDGIRTRPLDGGCAVTLVHKGPYAQLFRSYAKLFSYLRERGYEAALPSREVYLKGPGMIFKGNPDRYLTEIQVVVS